MAKLSQAPGARILVSPEPPHGGRITRMLFGNFIELLDDHVPGMWAEMLNDRSFDGVLPPSNWVYHTGEPNQCDRPWDSDESWSYDSDHPFSGTRCARLTTRNGRARLSQSGLAARKEMRYSFSGYLRSDDPDIRARVALKALLPDGEWLVLASAELPALSGEWCRYTAVLGSSGSTDRAVFELTATGNGSLLADKLSLVPSDNVGGWRSDVVHAVASTHPGVIRWGGLAVDPGAYKWKEGIGDRSTRTPFPNRAWGRMDPNDVGIDEFCTFCETVGAEPVVCVSFADGAGSAADLVQYCNGGPGSEWGRRRAANGHPRPYRVKYWQIGNEVDASAEYLAAAEGFCRAIKAADGDAIIMCYRPTQELLDRVGRYLGFVCPHHYDVGDLEACAAELSQIAEMLRRTPDCQGIRIGITEWNVAGGDWGFERGRLATLVAALRNARYLNLLLRRSDVVGMACRSNMANSYSTGILMTSPSGILKPPSYHVMKLYADHLRPIPRGVEGAPEGVDIMACASENGESVCVFAINMKDQPVDLCLDLDGHGATWGPAGGEMVCDTRDFRQPDVMNHWTAPDRVRTVELPVSGDCIILPALSVAAVECESRVTSRREGASSGTGSGSRCGRDGSS